MNRVRSSKKQNKRRKTLKRLTMRDFIKMKRSRTIARKNIVNRANVIDLTLSGTDEVNQIAIRQVTPQEPLPEYEKTLREKLLNHVLLLIRLHGSNHEKANHHFVKGYLPTQYEMRVMLRSYAPEEIPNFDTYLAILLQEIVVSSSYWGMIQAYYGESFCRAEYKANLPSPIILINSHGAYDVDAEFMPINVFKSDVKVFLYRPARPSCSNFVNILKVGIAYQMLKSIYLDIFTPKDIVGFLNAEACYKGLIESKGQELLLYKEFCYRQIDVIMYEPGDEIPNKKLSFNKEVDCNMTGYRVVCDSPFLSSKNLLVGISRENVDSTRQIILTAQKRGAKECHIIDFGCSTFVQDGVIIEGEEKHIRAWEKRKYGGRR